MKKILLSLAVAAAMVTGAHAATINVGTEATFAPFEFMDEQTKELTGFDMEIIEAVAKEMGDEVRIHNMGFDALIPSLQTGIIDVTVAAMTITPERQKRVDFTDVGRTHPASSVAAALVALADFPEAVGQHKLGLGQNHRFGGSGLQNGLYQILMFHSCISL